MVCVDVDTYRVEEPEPVMVAGQKEAVASQDNPSAVRVMLPLKPFSAVVDRLNAAVSPAVISTESTEITIEKSETTGRL